MDVAIKNITKIPRKESFLIPESFEIFPFGKTRGNTFLRFTVSRTKNETTKLKIHSKDKNITEDIKRNEMFILKNSFA